MLHSKRLSRLATRNGEWAVADRATLLPAPRQRECHGERDFRPSPSQDDLAGRADVSRATVNKLETGRDLSSLALRSLRAAFERDGVLFVQEGDMVGSTPASLGVALRRDRG